MTPNIKACVRNFNKDPTAFIWFDNCDTVSPEDENYEDGYARIGQTWPPNLEEVPLPYEVLASVQNLEGRIIIATFKRTKNNFLFEVYLASGKILGTASVELERPYSSKKIWTPKYVESALHEYAPQMEADDPKTPDEIIKMLEMSCLMTVLNSTSDGSKLAYSPVKRKPAKGSGACKPLYDWHTVVLEPTKPKQPSKGGTHARPRGHDVRGHFSTSSLGKRYWIGPYKKKGTGGFIFKDYTTKPRKSRSHKELT